MHALTETPYPTLPEITLRAAGVVPPIVLPTVPHRFRRCRLSSVAVAKPAVPVASVPM